MEQIFIRTKKNVNRLISGMFLDKGKYGFQKSKEGILIVFDAERGDSFEAFVRRFSQWFSQTALVHNGDLYFQDSPLQEIWNIWKEDVRFLYVYCDEHYEKWMERYLTDFFLRFSEFDSLEVSLEDLLLDVSDFVKTRLSLVKKHFIRNKHVEYIERHVRFRNQAKLCGMKLSQ